MTADVEDIRRHTHTRTVSRRGNVMRIVTDNGRTTELA